MSRLHLVVVVCALAAAGCSALGGAPPTPFAPNDLAFTLPRQVRGEDLELLKRPADLFIVGDDDFRRLLLDVGKEPSDVIVAGVSRFELSDPLDPNITADSLSILALRIRGVTADRIASRLLASSSPPPTLLPLNIQDRSVVDAISDGQTAVTYLYAKGEVLYIVLAVDSADPSDARVDADAAIAALS